MVQCTKVWEIPVSIILLIVLITSWNKSLVIQGNAVLDVMCKCTHLLEECVNMSKCLSHTVSDLHLGVTAHWFRLHCFSGKEQEMITVVWSNNMEICCVPSYVISNSVDGYVTRDINWTNLQGNRYMFISDCIQFCCYTDTPFYGSFFFV